MNRRIQRIHFVGIGGVGMSGLAEILHASGYSVSGSDKLSSTTTERLGNLGISAAPSQWRGSAGGWCFTDFDHDRPAHDGAAFLVAGG